MAKADPRAGIVLFCAITSWTQGLWAATEPAGPQEQGREDPPASAGAETVESAEPAESAESAEAAPPECYPRCREGYTCHQGRCVSLCNPPCPETYTCVEGARCQPPTSESASGAAPGIYEPPPPPPPKETPFPERRHSLLAFHMGLGGSADDAGTSTPLATSYGVNLRIDIPVVKYLLLGPLFQFETWLAEPPGVELSRDYVTDIDFYLRGRLPVELDSTALQLWAGIPVGLTLSFLGEDHASNRDGFALGWNIGVLVGGAFHFTPEFGMFVEVGWLQHRMKHDAAGVVPDLNLRLGQMNINLGFVFGE